MNPVVHFEMPYEDRDRAASFYEAAFGWKMQKLGPEMNEYMLAETAPTKDGRPTEPGTINGGFYAPTPESGSTPSVVIAVEDITAAMEKVTKAGGKVLGEPQEIPGVGTYGGFLDTEGTRVGMLQPAQRSQRS